MILKTIDILRIAKKNGIQITINEKGGLQLKFVKGAVVDPAVIQQIKDNKHEIAIFLRDDKWKSKKLSTAQNGFARFDRNAMQNIPLSFSQERLWFIHQLEGSVQYHLPTVLQLKGPLNVEALNEAFRAILTRHESLRTVFTEVDGQPFQSIRSDDAWQMDLVDGSCYVGNDIALERFIDTLVRKPFDLSNDFMIRSTLINLEKKNSLLVVTMHHISADAWSLSIIVSELAQFYSAFAKNASLELEPLSIQYTDFAIWQRSRFDGEAIKKKIDYWKNKLVGSTPLQLPTDFERPTVRTTLGGYVNFRVDKDLTGSIKSLGREHGASMFMTLLAVYKLLLHRYSGQKDISVGTPVAGRDVEEISGMIGFFVNTLALRTEFDDDISFIQLLQRVKETTTDAFDNQELPFEKVVEAVVRERDSGYSPLFQVMLVLNNTPAIPQLKLGELELTNKFTENNTSKFDISFYVNENSNGLDCAVQYRTDLFREETILRMVSHFKELMKAAVNFPESPIGNLQMLSAKEQLMLEQFSMGTVLEYKRDQTIVDLFEAQVRRAPSAEAIVFEGKSVSYKELDERSNQLAHYLRTKGVREDSLVPLCVDRSLEMMVGLMGILKAGAAYVPVEPEFPEERKAFLLKDTGATVAVSTTKSSTTLPQVEGLEIIKIDDQNSAHTKQPVSSVHANFRRDQLAYVIYTSGTTGIPKGVMIEHRNLVDYVFGLQKRLQIHDCRSYALVSSIATDLGNTVIFSSLVFGGALHIFSKDAASNAKYMQEYFATSGIECLKIVPSHWKALCTDGELLLPSTLLVFGGEALTAGLVERIQNSTSNCRVVNHYGPTETTIGKLLHEVQEGRNYRSTIPIGRTFSNTKVYVLSKQMMLCPLGIAGELYIGGEGVARGYLNNAKLTSEQFIENPLENNETTRLYRTGDMVRWLGDGEIEFIGRVDDQAKIRGYRVELGEIEQKIFASGMISQVVVLAKEDKQGEKRLVGYLVTNDHYVGEQLIAYLRQGLPEYMVPLQWVEMDQFPMLPNGKIDKRSLPEPETAGKSGKDYVAPVNQTQHNLASIWQVLLGVEKVGIQDDFFELGGHSLLAVRLISAIRKQLGVEIPIRDIFDNPTINLLSSRVQERLDQTVLKSILHFDPRPSHIPLSFSQERLWFIDQLEGSTHYHRPAVLQLKGKIDHEILRKVFQDIVNRHEILRTVFHEESGTAYQTILSKDRFKLETADLRSVKKESREKFIQELIRKPFDLSVDHMLRAALVSVGRDEYILVLVIHHIASDGWSISIIVKEITELYAALQQKRIPVLPALPVQYADFAIWQRRPSQIELLSKKLDYWKKKLTGIEPLQLPTDFPRPSKRTHNGDIAEFHFDEETNRKLHELSKRQGTTIFMTLLAIFKLLLFRYSGQKDICVGTPIAGRQQQDVENLIGFFINTLALRTEVDPDASFIELLRGIRQTTLDAFENQELPFEKIVDATVKRRDPARSPLFQIMFILQNTPAVPSLKLDQIQIIKEENTDHTTALFDITFTLSETASGLSGAVLYSTDLYKRETIERMIVHFRESIDSIIKNPKQKISSVNLLSSHEYQYFTQGGIYRKDYSTAPNVVELFEEQANILPSAAAIHSNGGKVSYKELNERSNQLARYLNEMGVGKDSLVPICADRSAEMVIGILAVLKAGAAYVPVDPSYPEERITYILKDTSARVVLVDSNTRSKILFDQNITQVLVDKDNGRIANHSVLNPGNKISADSLAYVIYTSGSTGKPKGVLIEQKGLRASTIARKEYYDQVGSVFLVPSFAFDSSVAVIFGTLSSGGQLILSSEDAVKDVEALTSVLNHTDTILCVPSYYRFLLQEKLIQGSGISKVILAGEELDRSLVSAHFDETKNIRLYNEYGPTETTVWATVAEIEADTDLVTIGKPISSVRAYIMDASLQLVPIGVTGELCIGGVQLARGYLNEPGLTARQFIVDPFSDGQERIYRTGDLCRWLPDGRIEYLGRTDEQVKIRGYRIEPGEIEKVLQSTGKIKQAAVVAKPNAIGNLQLVAYVVAEEFNHLELVDLLKKGLPEYMIPSVWVRLKQMPLTPNGKTDRKQLPEPVTNGQFPEQYIEPVTAVEKQLVHIWQELLGIEQVGITDNFFELGGHSLLAVRLVSAIRKRMASEIFLRDIFEHPTIAGLAKPVEANSQKLSADAVMKVQNRPERIPLSFTQERLWFIDRLQGSIQYHMPSVFRLKGALDLEALQEAMISILDRHEVLRTVLKELDGVTWQEIRSAADWRLEVIDGSSFVNNEDGLRDYIKEKIKKPFDLSTDFMVRTSVISLAREEQLLLTTMHHIASDGWSMSVFVKELKDLYEAKRGKREALLPALRLQYADYSIWQRSSAHQQIVTQKLEYWQKKLAGVQPLELPTDYTRPATPSLNGAVIEFNIGKDITKQLHQVRQHEGATLFMSLLAGFKVLLYRYSGQEDICVGTPVAGRNQEELESLIGSFINTLAIRSELAADLSFSQLLSKLKHTTLEAFENQQVPFEKVVDDVVKKRDFSRHALFQVMFVLQNTPSIPEIKMGELTLSSTGFEHTTGLFDLTFSALEIQDDIRIAVQYSKDLYNDETIQRMATHFRQLLHSLVSDPNQSIGSVTMIGEEERTLIESFNETNAYYPADQTISELFEKQVFKTPHGTALSFNDRQWSYVELNRRSNQFADYLRSNGIRKGSIVPICIDRGPEMIITILAILKLGAAFVPVDASYPQERITYVINDVNATFIIASENNKSKLIGAARASIITLDNLSRSSINRAVDNPGISTDGSGLAYVIYTSGSTGRPKGVMVEHSSIVNLLVSVAERIQFSSFSKILSVTSYSFDISYLEFFLPLMTGGQLILAPRDVAVDGSRLLKEVNRCCPTHMQATPSTWQMLVDLGWENQESVMILTGGEAITDSLKDQLAKHSIVWNMYGPTETTIWSTSKQLQVGEKVSIGRPISNTQVCIVDKNNQPCPLMIPGEILIGGVGVARGYWKQPELTSDKFISGSGNLISRLYKTGDIGRWLPDGNIEFLGRADHQVKIRGYRIELEEIENCLHELGNISQAVVVAREMGTGDKQLIAYTVADEFNKAITIAHLEGKLPAYMIPAIWVSVPGLPLTPNGKIDRKALPAPPIITDPEQSVAPGTREEIALALIWKDLLGFEHISVTDSFFEIGGHSLLAVQLIAAIRKEFSIDIPLAEIFSRPTIQSLASRIAAQSSLTQNGEMLVPKSYGNSAKVGEARKPGKEGNFIVAVKTTGKGLPFYGIISYNQCKILADSMPEDQPFYYLPPTQSGSVEEIAAKYIQDIKLVQPTGPYVIGGFCGGGKIALEIAQQMIANGDQIASLVLFELYAPKTLLSPFSFTYIKRRLRYYKNRFFSLNADYSYYDVTRFIVKKSVGNVAKPFVKAVQPKLEKTPAFANYQFKPYHGKIVMFKAGIPPLEVREAPLMGWLGYFTGEVDVISIAGGHLGIFRQPGIHKTAEKLAEVLAEISSSATTNSGGVKS